jgi:hypothetical protein
MKNDDNSKSECREKEGLTEKIMMNFTNFLQYLETLQF